MNNLSTYIIEKLHLNKDTEIQDIFNLNTVYLIIHKTITEGELKVFVENTIKIIEVNKENKEIKIEPIDWKSTFKFDYYIYDNHIILAKDEFASDKSLLLEKEEAINFLKSLKDNDYLINLSYFGEDDKKVAVREDSKEHKINDDEIQSHIDELENA